MNIRQTGALLWLTALCYACAEPMTVRYPPYAHEPARLIYLVSHGWHTGIVVKRQDIPLDVWSESRDFPDADYLEIGWGEGDYYQAREPSVGLALKAACGSTASVLHVVGFKGSVTACFPQSDIIALELSPRGFERLCDYIHNSYDRAGRNKALPVGPGLYGDSQFYPARGQFYLFNTCNVWTAQALHAAGYPLSSFCALTADSVMSQARQFGSVVQDSSAVAPLLFHNSGNPARPLP